MRFHPTPIDGAFIIDLEPREDERGSFSRSFCAREFQNAKINFTVVQCNLARTKKAGTVRGLHFLLPAAEQKLVRCITGAVYDVIIDMRPNSQTFHRKFEVELNTIDRKSLFVPGGVAHGYQTLADNTEFFYMTDEFYVPGIERGVRFNDPAFGINWPLPPTGVGERDFTWPDVHTSPKHD